MSNKAISFNNLIINPLLYDHIFPIKPRSEFPNFTCISHSAFSSLSTSKLILKQIGVQVKFLNKFYHIYNSGVKHGYKSLIYSTHSILYSHGALRHWNWKSSSCLYTSQMLTHWCLLMHTWSITDSGNGLLPGWHQAINGTNDYHQLNPSASIVLTGKLVSFSSKFLGISLVLYCLVELDEVLQKPWKGLATSLSTLTVNFTSLSKQIKHWY